MKSSSRDSGIVLVTAICSESRDFAEVHLFSIQFSGHCLVLNAIPFVAPRAIIFNFDCCPASNGNSVQPWTQEPPPCATIPFLRFHPNRKHVPGSQSKMEPYPDCGEQSYAGHDRLAGKIALITGADSGIGRAVAIAYAREGADVAVSYLDEHDDARETDGGSSRPGANANFTGGLAQLLGDKGIRVNSVAPGPIGTPLIVSTMPPEEACNFGAQTPLGRPGQPIEVAPIFVLLVSDEGSYISGSRYGVTGGKPML